MGASDYDPDPPQSGEVLQAVLDGADLGMAGTRSWTDEISARYEIVTPTSNAVNLIVDSTPGVPVVLPSATAWRLGFQGVSSLKLVQASKTIRRHSIPGIKFAAILSEMCEPIEFEGRHIDPLAEIGQCAPRWLDLSDTDVDAKSLAPLLSRDSLIWLDLTRCRHIDDEAMAIVGRALKLRRLSLQGTSVTGHGLGRLSALQSLRAIALPADVEDADLEALSSMSGLLELDVSSRRLTDSGIRHLRDAKGLRRIRLSCANVTGSGLSSLDLQDLRDLDVKDCSDFSDDGLRSCGAMKGLERLVLQGTSVTAAGLAQLEAVTRLKGLDIEGVPIGDAALVSLMHMDVIEDLIVGGGDAKATAIAGISRCRRMRTLNLSGMTLGKAEIEELAGLTGLQSLDIRRCASVGEGLLMELRQRLPKCKILAQ